MDKFSLSLSKHPSTMMQVEKASDQLFLGIFWWPERVGIWPLFRAWRHEAFVPLRWARPPCGRVSHPGKHAWCVLCCCFHPQHSIETETCYDLASVLASIAFLWGRCSWFLSNQSPFLCQPLIFSLRTCLAKHACSIHPSIHPILCCFARN